MKSLLSTIIGCAVLLFSQAAAATGTHYHLPIPVPPPNVFNDGGRAAGGLSPVPQAVQAGTFNQLTDHSDPSKGTFPQRYWFNNQFYKEGGPIIIFTPGEAAAAAYTGYLANQTLTGYLGQKFGALVVLVEHRFWGTSHPGTASTVENLQYLTLNNSVTDFAYFAQNVKFSGITANTHPTETPWIFVGGSYSGALASWVKAQFGDLFWIAYSTSGVVEAVYDYWQYWVPIQEGLPKNCSTDAAAVIAHVDDVLLNGSEDDVTALKTLFGLEGIVHNDDFASALTLLPGQWQQRQAYTGPDIINEWCDALEIQNGTVAGPDGFGLEVALPAWGNFMADIWPLACGGLSADDCFGTYDATSSFYTSTSFSQDYRQWNWFTCTTFGYWQNGAPTNTTSIVSRLVTDGYWEHQCELMFPGYKLLPGPDYVNTNYGGWSLSSKRLFTVNAGTDPWREATRSSDFGPQLPSTDEQPIFIIRLGIHCWDLIVANWINVDIPPIISAAVSKIQGWLGEFEPATTKRAEIEMEKAIRSFGRRV